MTKVFLAAGVAALAIAAQANAGPHGGGKADRVAVSGGGGDRVAVQRPQRAERIQQFSAPRVERQQRFAAIERPQRAERVQQRAVRQQQVQVRTERARTRVAAQRPARIERQQAQTRVQQARPNRIQQAQTRMQERQQVRANRTQQAQARVQERQQLRANRVQQTQTAQVQPNRVTARQDVMAQRQQLRAERQANAQDRIAVREQIQANRQAVRVANVDAFRTSRLAALAVTPRTRVIAPAQATQLVGLPVSQATTIVPLVAVPQSISYLYPDTPNYYYQYGDGYLYQVDRTTSLIAALLPLLGGGYMPGQYLPAAYMSSYVPDYYGLNSFYPASYDYGYGSPYGYQNLCNRYYNGVIYQVDCVTGLVEDVIPTYAGGYGVGQILPTAYSTYNVPYQYRSMYYDTPDYNYWYAPGAIYQYDPGSSMITSVAALLSPGFSVGQPLPIGYSTYNVPYAYRATYYDTPDAWYRYNNGYIYQVNPATQLVTAIVASLLT